MKKQELLNNIKTNMEDIIRTLKKYDIEALFSLYDLKLYDMATMDNIDDDLFDFICQCEYNNFKEYLEENNCILKYLGRTSSFWVISEYSRISEYDLSETLSNGLNFKLEILVNEFLYEYINYDLEVTIDKDFNFTYNSNITDENWYDVDDLERLADLLTDYKRDLQEFIEYNITKPLEVIEYINDFKANQELIYNEYAECNE